MNRKFVFAGFEWLAILLLLWLVWREDLFMPGSFTPEQAHRLSESGFHYGPSTIVRKVTVPFDQHQVIFLGTYNDWFSADTVVKKKGGWMAGGGVGGIKIDRDKALSYSWEGSSLSRSLMTYKFYGYVSDDRITTVELLMTDKETGKLAPMREAVTEDRMFLFLWESKQGSATWQAIRGLDKEGGVLYEQSLS
ncbi:hypothetical protein OMP38_10615 [Cohnella ginsengisoli]|uniref:DUF5044 domain-containing protein n=1 Tax=Cohnella ginsengisoli TaxID=425004 RepID=A0A9X4KFP5_9BACL|nr:hypothetical protein [Cohnella ginsengisoli]MDG0791273.1 hypothetical protein [Cohnella ginsengisoli]